VLGGTLAGTGLPDNPPPQGGETFIDYAKSPLFRPISDYGSKESLTFAGISTGAFAVKPSADLMNRFRAELIQQYGVSGGSGPNFAGGARAPLWPVPPGTPPRFDVPVENTAFHDVHRDDLETNGIPLPDFVKSSSHDDGLTNSDQAMALLDVENDTYYELFQMQQRVHFPILGWSVTPSSGGTVPPGLQVYKVTAFNENGETYARASGYQVNVNGSQKVTIDWTGWKHAEGRIDGWRIYRGTSTNSNQCFRIGQTTENVKTFVDDGSVTPNPSLSCPTTNTATTPGLWQAAIISVFRNVSESPGWARNIVHPGFEDWPETVNDGESASEIYTALMRIQKGDIVRGVIDHVIDIGLRNLPGVIHPNIFFYPCQNCDGRSTLVDKIPYGLRVTFPDSIDFDTYDFATGGWMANITGPRQ
jgi:hypothetical protein